MPRELTKVELEIIQKAQVMIDEAKSRLVNQQDRNFIIQQITLNLKNSLTPVLEEISKTTKEAVDQYIEGISKLRIEAPNVEVHAPEVEVNVPKIDIPEIKVPKAEIEVKIPKIEVPEIKFPEEKLLKTIKKGFEGIKIENPEINIPETKFPKSLEVKGISGFAKAALTILKGRIDVKLGNINQGNPLPVVLIDERGMVYKALTRIASIGGGGGSRSEASPTALAAFITDIPSAGTRIQLAGNTVIAGVIQAPSTNTGNVYIGGSDVSSTVFGAELQPGQSTGIAISNTNLIYIDAATSGDDVAFLGS